LISISLDWGAWDGGIELDADGLTDHFPWERVVVTCSKFMLHWRVSCRMLESGCRCHFYASACGLCLYLADAVVL
jgi:hypothetical protein